MLYTMSCQMFKRFLGKTAKMKTGWVRKRLTVLSRMVWVVGLGPGGLGFDNCGTPK